VAASLAVRALELTPRGDPGALPRLVAAAEALTAAGRFDHAARFARDGLAQPLPPLAEARLRCALSSILAASGQPGQARAEAQAVLSLPQLPPDLRDEALTAQLHALAGLGDDQAAEGVAAAILATPGQHGSQAVTAALITRATSAWDGGRISDALHLLREAARRGGAVSPDARHDQPLLALAAALADLGREKEAEEVLQAIDRETLEGTPAHAVMALLEARLFLGRGSLAPAEAAARTALAAAGPARSYAWLAQCLLANVALREGDLQAATHHLAGCPSPVPRPAAIYARAAAASTHARVTEAREGPGAAIGHIRALWDGQRPGLLLGEPGTSAWLIRTALATGDHDLAGRLGRAAAALARDNLGIPAVAAEAAHGMGLLGRDPALLAQAAAEPAGPWAQASAAEDLGVLLAESDKDRAIACLTSALDGYRQAGATGDSARVRGRLRALGVRRRHWKPAPGRPVTGWESLTEAEHATAELAAQGLNNKQIAGRLYISRHTVAFHLRQIFMKLHIGSRVELTRIVIEHAGLAFP
jgi:ATP/maltotriose-dependent transcriptional regulator MalT